jgi:hypothetical protein
MNEWIRKSRETNTKCVRIYLDLKENIFSNREPWRMQQPGSESTNHTTRGGPMKPQLLCQRWSVTRIGDQEVVCWSEEEFSLLVSSEEKGKTKTSLIGEGSWLGIETVELQLSGEEPRLEDGQDVVFSLDFCFCVFSWCRIPKGPLTLTSPTSAGPSSQPVRLNFSLEKIEEPVRWDYCLTRLTRFGMATMTPPALLGPV